MISTDAFIYQAYARMFTDYGTNPYLHGPSVIQLDPVYAPLREYPRFRNLTKFLAPAS